jgi:RHS repeat-associated protein
VQTRYLGGQQPNQWFARVDSTGVAWLLTDYQGSVRVVMTATGGVAQAVQYDAYGNIVSSMAPSTALGRLGFQGMEYHSELGDDRDNGRWIGNGRFLTQDPTGLGPDENPYRFVGNDPTNATDPSGCQTEAVKPRIWSDTNELRGGNATVYFGDISWLLRYEVEDTKGLGKGILARFRYTPRPTEALGPVAFIQIVKRTRGGNNVYPTDNAGVSLESYSKVYTSAAGWRIDHIIGATSPYATAAFAGGKWIAINSGEIGGGAEKSTAVLKDAPSSEGSRAGTDTVTLYETAAVEITPKGYRVLGVVRWGFVIPAKAGEPIKILPVAVADDPSENFLAAYAQAKKAQGQVAVIGSKKVPLRLLDHLNSRGDPAKPVKKE